jgi:WD40 repeat protein
MALALRAMPQAHPDGWPVLARIPEVQPVLYAATVKRRELAVLRGHERAVRSAVFSPDGARVVTASADATARLWDAGSGAEIAVLRGHKRGVRSAVFSPDGARVVTASDDATARLWDAGSGAEIAVLRGHEGAVRSAVFSPDGARVVTASDDRTARLWQHYSTASELYEHAREIVDRLEPLTDWEKCAYYLITEGCEHKR